MTSLIAADALARMLGSGREDLVVLDVQHQLGGPPHADLYAAGCGGARRRRRRRVRPADLAGRGPRVVGAPLSRSRPSPGTCPSARGASRCSTRPVRHASPRRGSSSTPGRLLPADALRARFHAVGAHRGGDAPVGAYCGSGITAAHTVLAMYEAGIAAIPYIGSWSAWITDPDRPVATG